MPGCKEIDCQSIREEKTFPELVCVPAHFLVDFFPFLPFFLEPSVAAALCLMLLSSSTMKAREILNKVNRKRD